MTKQKIWNRLTQKWEEFDIPKGWKLTTFEDDMCKRVNCAGCGERIRFKDSFTSSVLRDELDLGYAVCRKCWHWEEDARRPQSSLSWLHPDKKGAIDG